MSRDLWLLFFLFFSLSACTHVIDEKNMFHPQEGAAPLVREGFVGNVHRENVEIKPDESTTIRGWYLWAPQYKGTLIYFYGNAQRVTDLTDELFWLADHLKINILVFDYRGYGFSSGHSTFDGISADSLKIYDFLKKKGARGPIYVYGYSIGTVFAGVVAENRRVDGLILVAPMTSALDTVSYWDKNMPWPQKWFISLHLEDSLKEKHPQPIERVKNIGAPLLIIHGTGDEFIPPFFGEKMYQNASSMKKEWCPVEGADHKVDITKKPAIECIDSFIIK